MSKVVAWCTAVVLVGSAVVCGPSAAAQPAGSWGRAIGVPGLAALNSGGSASVTTLSCPSAGNCAASGYYSDRHEKSQGFVAAERKGRWGKAIEVPGLGALNKGGFAKVDEVSCGSAGNCVAGGYYSFGPIGQRGFVAVERNGLWSQAIEVPGLGTLNTGRNATVRSVSCGSAGNCAAGGYYSGRQANAHGFAVLERNGRWGKAIQVPGLGTLNKHGDAWVNSVSCGSAGRCAAGGIYDAQRDDQGQGFVTAERNGRWSTAIRVPGVAALNKGDGVTQVLTVSCAAAGTCAAGWYYASASGDDQGLVTQPG